MCIQEKLLYRRIFSWENFIKFGYFDFKSGKNHKYVDETDIMYGNIDFIDPSIFNFFGRLYNQIEHLGFLYEI